MAAAALPIVPASPPPTAVVLDYMQQARLKSLEQAKAQYKSFFRLRAQEFIRGKGALAVVTDNVCMGCTHCFDNCAFESIDMVERKFSLPEYEYTSRKAVIIEENCVGCEKCAIACPVDAITMVPQEGYEVKDGRLLQIVGAQVPDMPPFLQPPKPGKPRPPLEASKFEPMKDADRVTHRISAAFKPKVPPVAAKAAVPTPPTALTSPLPAVATPPPPPPPQAVRPAELSPQQPAATTPPPAKAEVPPPPPPPLAVKPVEVLPPQPAAVPPPLTEEELPPPADNAAKPPPKKKAKEEK